MMAEKKTDPADALVAVLKALGPLNEPDRQWVLQSAAARWSLQLQGSASGGAAGGGLAGAGNNGAGAADAQAAIAKKDARAFMRAKRPATDMQRVACLGYFLVHTTNKPGFTSKEIGQANTESGGTSINLPRALDNATRTAKYLANRGVKEKQLTTLGEDIVDALPDQTAVKEIEGAMRGRSKRAKRKKKA